MGSNQQQHQPTLMLGNLDLTLDFTAIIDAVSAVEPYPIQIRYGRTKDTNRMNIFFEYNTYEDGRIVRRKLHGKKVADKELNLDFTTQDGEISLFVSYTNTDLSIHDIEKVFDKYTSVLGASSYMNRDKLMNSAARTFFIRFSDLNEAILAIMEMSSVYHYDKSIFVSLSARHINDVKLHVYEREISKIQQGIPAFHNLYTKRRLTVEESNAIIVGQEFEFQQDFEASRWSHLPYSEVTYDQDYDMRLMYDYYHNI